MFTKYYFGKHNGILSAVSADYRFKGGPIDLKLSNAFEMSEREKLKNFKDPTSVFNLA